MTKIVLLFWLLNLREKRLFTQTQAINQLAVTLFTLSEQEVEQAAALGDLFQQTTARVIVFFVLFEMLSELSDRVGEQRDLDLWRTSVAFEKGVVLDDLCFGGFVKCHSGISEAVSLRPFLFSPSRDREKK